MLAPFLLDTHILSWWTLQPSRVSRAQRHALRAAAERGDSVGISAITLWELAMMADRGRIEPPMPVDLWLAEIEEDAGIDVLPMTGRIAHESVVLDSGFPKDPADRIIVATARCHGLQLLTADTRIRQWGGVAIL